MSSSFGTKYISRFNSTYAQSYNIRTDTRVFASTVSTSGFTGVYTDDDGYSSYPIISTSANWESSTQGGTPANSAILIYYPIHVYSNNNVFYCLGIVINVGKLVSGMIAAGDI